MITLHTLAALLAKLYKMPPALKLSLKTRSGPVTYTTLVIWVSVMICLIAICGCVALLVFIKHRLRQSR